MGLAATSRFETGSFAATGLDDGCADAVMTIDAFQYATDKRAACAEIARILRRGGRFVFTAFEVEPSRVAGLPILGDDPVADYTASLEAAGFEVDSYSETTAWWERVAASYRAVLDAEAVLTEEMGAPAFGALASEMSMTLAVEPYRRRVFGVATRT